LALYTPVKLGRYQRKKIVEVYGGTAAILAGLPQIVLIRKKRNAPKVSK
jgi:hypothetical protein